MSILTQTYFLLVVVCILFSYIDSNLFLVTRFKRVVEKHNKCHFEEIPIFKTCRNRVVTLRLSVAAAACALKMF